MKHNPIDRMKDPFYAGLLFQIEQMICQADDEAKRKGMELTDSQVRSAIIKAQKKAQGEDPNIPVTNEREQILAALIDSICQAPYQIMEQTLADDGTEEHQPLAISYWVNALETVQDSIKTRKRNVPGSRDYLNYLPGFIARARGIK